MTEPHVRDYTIKVLGRTLEHLGYQMYKRRDGAIAELVANCWDAGASRVSILLPEGSYEQANSEIVIQDDGSGMDEEAVQDDYLVVGRNRREDHSGGGRAVMGRKGIGKLAGFGIASEMEVTTWRDGTSTKIVLDAAALKVGANVVSDVRIQGEVGPAPPDQDHGTRIVLRRLKHATPMDSGDLVRSLGRRFSRTVRGGMEILVNGITVSEPVLDLAMREPSEGDGEATLADGAVVRYHLGFTKKPIPQPEMRGFAILVRGKVAQAPPYFFGVEGTASGQHGTRYLNGAIEADFVDEGDDEESDIISTDRQEIEWDSPRAQALKSWGEEVTRRALREWANRRADALETEANADPELHRRLEALDPTSRRKAIEILRSLGPTDTDEGAGVQLGDSIVRAFEYRHFHDVIGQIDATSDDPEQVRMLLMHLSEWKVLESRAILEIIEGRLHIVEKFHSMIVENAPETAPKIGEENMHDLIAAYPWLIDPDWQVLAEETALTTTLREWGDRDIDPADRRRYDFLALQGESRVIIIEIKRSGYTVTHEDLARLVAYKEVLRKAHNDIEMVMISGGDLAADPHDFATVAMLPWAQVYERTRRFYEHYRALLEGDVASGDFFNKQREVAQTRQVLERGAYRSPEDRRAGLGPQDFPVTRTLASVAPDPRPDTGNVPGAPPDEVDHAAEASQAGDG